MEEIEDFTFEEETDADNSKDAQSIIKKLKEKIKKLESEKTENLAGWQRSQADFANYKKDENDRLKSYAKRNQEEMILDLLPVLDSYDMAFANREAWEKVDKNWRVGVEYIHQQILKFLADYGVTEIAPEIGSAFDHNTSQSSQTDDTNDQNLDHTVSALLQKGYKNGDKILRPARVKIYTFKQD